MTLLGLDIGTTSCKAALFSADGDILSQATREYPILAPHPGWAEQDAEHVWRLAWDALTETLRSAGNAAPRALALSVQGEAVIPVDAAGNALRLAILGMDTRTGRQNEWLRNHFGAAELFRRTGMPLHTINTLPKLLWLRQHEPDIWRRASRFLLYEDFMLQKLGGEAVISHCLASRTQMYNLTAVDWDDDILSACGIGRERLAPLAPKHGGRVGALRSELATALGLSQEVVLVAGGHDQACAALGSRVTKPGLAMVSTGTAEVVEVALAYPSLTPPLERGNISVYRHVVPELYLAMTLNHSGGLLLRWFRDTLCASERDAARTCGIDPYDAILQGAPSHPTDLLLLPHFAGSGTPWMDTASLGAILGLSFGTTKGVLAKACLEGLCYELRMNLEVLAEGGVTVDTLHAVGGGARSPLWLQLKADVLDLPLWVPQITDAACLGAALLAGVGVGVYENLDAAVEVAVHERTRIWPRPERVEAYDKRYALYRQVYPTLRELLHRLHTLALQES